MIICSKLNISCMTVFIQSQGFYEKEILFNFS